MRDGIILAILCEFAFDVGATTTHTVAFRVATLDANISLDTMERKAIIEAATSKADEVVHRDRRSTSVELDRDRAIAFDIDIGDVLFRISCIRLLRRLHACDPYAENKACEKCDKGCFSERGIA